VGSSVAVGGGVGREDGRGCVFGEAHGSSTCRNERKRKKRKEMSARVGDTTIEESENARESDREPLYLTPPSPPAVAFLLLSSSSLLYLLLISSNSTLFLSASFSLSSLSNRASISASVSSLSPSAAFSSPFLLFLSFFDDDLCFEDLCFDDEENFLDFLEDFLLRSSSESESEPEEESESESRRCFFLWEEDLGRGRSESESEEEEERRRRGGGDSFRAGEKGRTRGR